MTEDELVESSKFLLTRYKSPQSFEYLGKTWEIYTQHVRFDKDCLRRKDRPGSKSKFPERARTAVTLVCREATIIIVTGIANCSWGDVFTRRVGRAVALAYALRRLGTYFKAAFWQTSDYYGIAYGILAHLAAKENRRRLGEAEGARGKELVN